MQASNNSLVDDFAADKKNATSIFDNRDFLTEIKTDRKKFIAEVQNLDPDSISTIIALLQDLRQTSTTREQELLDDMNNKKNALDNANQVLIDAQDALDAANNNLATAEQTQKEAAEHAAAAKTDHTSKTSAHATAKELHDQEKPSLDDEQQVLTDVIDLMSGLHKKYAGPYTVGTCQPKNTYTEDECCAPGYHTISTTQDCRKAWEKLAIAGSNIGGDGDWDHRPAGCFWHQPNKYFHFNRLTTPGQITQGLVGDDKVICRQPSYSFGTCQPTGRYEDSQCCPSGYAKITTSEDCQTAMGAVIGELSGNWGGAHGWDHRPSGCFYHNPNSNYYFNVYNSIAQNQIGDDRVICKLIE